ncbi:ABC transporter substrate-binding protein [Rhizobium altiplani]|uniref:ABC transporter substrate-binding protein n=1 Tax=Rhizobium altiplani TaxID=1864509 RepID=A0A109J4Q6_9HYPH|nr:MULTISPECIES: ABC transporter substrate-binding protein [Rhizobium]KWV42310.1 ABC transporter substrate-binding protein [Rhizobium altiplani]
MIRAIKMALGLAALVVAVPYAAHADDVPENLKGSGEVVVSVDGGSYEAALRKAFFDPFTRDTGIKIVVIPPNVGKLLASVKLGQPEADITSVSGGEFPSWVSKGAVEPIDYGIFAEKTLAAIPDQMKNENGIGALLYSDVIAYSTKKYAVEGQHPKNWTDFYNVEAFPGERALPKCERILEGGLLVGALLSDGVTPDKLYPLDVDRGLSKIKKLMPHVGRWWAGGADAPQSLIAGDVDMAVAFNGRISTAKKHGAPIAFSWDQSIVQYDYWVVMKGTPNKENAFKFLAYISRPGPQAAFATEMNYGPINKEAFALLPADFARDLPGAPEIADKQVFENYSWWGEQQDDGRTNFDAALSRCVEVLAQ